MFNKISAQLQDSMKPVTDLAEVNLKAMKQLTQAQSELFNTVVSSNVAFAQELAGQKDIKGVVAAQKAYAEGLQETLNTAAQEAYALLTQTQEEAGEILKGAFSKAQETAVAAKPKPAKASTAA